MAIEISRSIFAESENREASGHLGRGRSFSELQIRLFTSAFVYCSRARVVQQKSPLAELLAEESEDGETRDSNFLEEEDRIFSWQEKVFSPSEIDFYADEKNCLTDCQREYCRRIRDEELHGVRLYSYTEDDSYYPDDGVLTKPYRQDIHYNYINRILSRFTKICQPFFTRHTRSEPMFHIQKFLIKFYNSQIVFIRKESDSFASRAESEALSGAV